jgi:hypothetical protein
MCQFENSTMRNDKPNIIVQKKFEFAVQIIDFTERLNKP